VEKNLSIFNFRKFPLAFACFLLLLFCTELVARYYYPTRGPLFDNIIEYKTKYLMLKENIYYDGIILGDSCSLGLDAKLVADIINYKTGKSLSFYNFSFPVVGAKGWYIFLRKYISLNQKPKIVFMESIPSLMTEVMKRKEVPTDELHRFALAFSLKDYYDIVPVDFSFKILMHKIKRQSYLVTYRSFIRDLASNFYRHRERGLMIDENGRVIFGLTEIPTLEEVQGSDIYKADFYLNEDILFWFKKFFSLARENDIKILIFGTPMSEEVSLKREERGINRRYEEAMLDLIAGYDNIVLIKPISEGYNRKYFYDANHLNDEGNDIFSVELGKRIAACIENSDICSKQN